VAFNVEGKEQSVKLTVERLPESQVLLDIAADEDEFNKAMDRAFRKVSQQVNVHGFRRGKAPRFIIEQMYGREIIVQEADEELMDKLYRAAIEQESLVPVGEPVNIEIVTPEPLNFKVTIPVYPEVEPGNYQEVRVEPADAAVEEHEVDEVVERIRKQESPWVDPAEPRTPHDGDQVTIDLAVKEGDEEFEEPVEDAVFVLGESNLFDRLREEIEKLNVGESATFDITFADDDETVNERVRGKTLTYTVTLKGLKEKDLLPLDDEFAKNVNESESLDALRQEIRDDIHRARTNEKRTEVVNEIINQMAEGATIEVPSVMIDEAVTEEVNNLRMRLTQQRQSLEEYLRLNEQTEEEFREELRPETARRLRNSLLLREIAKREEIDVADEDIDAEIDSMTAGAENADRLRELYSGNYFRNMLRNDLYDRRLTDRLIEHATENRGAVANPWIAPEPETETQPAEQEQGAEGAEPGEGETQSPAVPQPAVSVADVDQEPDAGQAAAAGHEQEQAAIAETDAEIALRSGEETVQETAGPPPPGTAAWVKGTGEHDCPEGYPIKGNASSMIYHVPGQSSYERTIPEMCFASEEAAITEGYRASKAGIAHEEEE
jgi:trigger factor